MIKIPPQIEYIIDSLQSENHQAYIVGGCVRDMLLGLIPNDFDVTTSATPQEVMTIFPKTVPTGIKHGTVTVIVDKEPIEVTTFRQESGYTDSRRPDSVSFVRSLEKDLMRRDFTVNAMAYNNTVGLADYYGGVKDLEARCLRAVGEPAERFSEDALRILRLFRFASQLEFSIENETLNAAIKMQKGLKNISRERIFTELYKASTGNNPKAITPLILSGGLEFLNITALPDFDLMKKCRDNHDLSFFIFLSDCGGDANEILNSLKASNNLKNYFKVLSELKALPIPKSKEEIKERLNLAGERIFTDFLRCAYIPEKEFSDIKNKLEEIISNQEPYRISDLKIDGKALKKIGYNGERIGEALERARKYVLAFPEKNNIEDLISFFNIRD